MTVRLSETGLIDWSDWTRAFGATLARHGTKKDLNGGEDYFNAWLETLETLLIERGVANDIEMRALKKEWTRAYIETPHGQPVALRS